jgi:hypothetical protein
VGEVALARDGRWMWFCSRKAREREANRQWAAAFAGSVIVMVMIFRPGPSSRHAAARPLIDQSLWAGLSTLCNPPSLIHCIISCRLISQSGALHGMQCIGEIILLGNVYNRTCTLHLVEQAEALHEQTSTESAHRPPVALSVLTMSSSDSASSAGFSSSAAGAASEAAGAAAAGAAAAAKASGLARYSLA